MTKPAAIDCKFDTAKPGDVIVFPTSPFKFGEVLGKLVKVNQGVKHIFHTYELYMFGVWIGTVEGRSDNVWRVIS